MTENFIIFFILLALINLIIVFNFNKISLKINIYDSPDNKRKIHKKPIAAIGGILIFFNLLIIYFFNYFFSFIEPKIEYLTIFSFIIFYICILDDKYNLSPNTKFFGTAVILSIFIIIDKSFLIEKIYFNSLNLEISLNSYSFFFTLLCLMLYINALNMFDGVNLQVSSYAIYVFIYLIFNSIYPSLFILLIVPMIYFSYLNYNNRLFLGDNGSCLLAFIISYAIITYNNQFSLDAEKLFLLMFLPGVDMLRLFIFRIYNKKNPFKADQQHIHHLLLKKLSKNQYFLIIQLFIVTPILLMNFYNNLILIIFYFFSYLTLLFYLNFKKNN